MHYRPEDVVKAFNIPEDLETTALLVMGYPADDAVPGPGHENSKPLTDFVKYE